MGAADGTVIGVTKILDSGAAERRFNIVLVAEGYRATELPSFVAHAQQFVDRLLATAPFDQLRCGTINVFRMDVASNESGADDPAACPGGTGATRATFFDASFCNGGIRRLLLVDMPLVLTVVDARVPEWHQILLVVNSSEWGGSGGLVAATAVAPGWEDVAIHEIGHSAFGLADEYEFYAGCGVDSNRDQYTGAEPAARNITTDASSVTIKWRALISAATPMPTTSNADCSQCDPQPNPVASGVVGAFEGAGYYHCGLHRPEFDCMMRNLRGFCGVCRERIRQTLTPYRADCLAPVFEPAGCLGCLILRVVYALAIVALSLFVWIPGVPCTIKQYRFRIAHCGTGNANPCLGL